MKLLVTGALTQDVNDLDMFRDLGFDVVYHKDERAELPCDPAEFDAVVCNGLFLYRDISEFANLKLIQLTSAGLDRVPVDEIKRRGIQLFNARGVYSAPMAEYVLSEVLDVYKAKPFYRKNQLEKKWNKKRDVDELVGKTVCVVGAGNVGGEVAKRFQAFDCLTIGVDEYLAPRPYFNEILPTAKLGEVLPKCDVVVLTVPLMESTKGLFNKDKFDLMKPTAIFVNIARGGVVVQNDLVDALREKKILCAVLDVFEEEPLPEDSPLWSLENASVTPHCSFISTGNKGRMLRLACKNLASLK